MRFLADENFPKSTVTALREDGHDVVWIRTDWPGATDAQILERAENERRLVLTLDKDFRQIALQRPDGLVQAGVLVLRLHPAKAAGITILVRSALKSNRDWAGHVSTVSRDRIEMIRASGAFQR